MGTFSRRLTSRRCALAVVVAAVPLALTASTGAAPGGLPDGAPAWVYQAEPLGLAPDGAAYVGAKSLVAVTSATPVVRIADGATDTSWPSVDRAEAAGADGRGGYYASSAAASGASAAVQHVLAATHAIDRGFTARFDREPAVVVVAGDAVLVAGFFRTVNGQPRAGLAALDAATGALRAWNPAPDGPVRALATGGDGTVYAAGEFGHIGGATRSGLAQLSLASGTATAWNPAPPTVTGNPMALAVTPSAVVMGGGFLWFVDKREMSRLVALDRTSGAATALGPTDSIGLFASDGEVSAVAVAGGTVYAGGSFATVGGQPRRGVAAFDLASGRLLPFAAANDGDVTSLVASSDGLIVSGDRVRKLDLATGAALPFSPIAGPGKLTVLGDAIVLVETSQTVGVGKAGGLAAIGPDGRPRASFTPPAGLEYGRALRTGDALFALGCPSRGCASGAAGIRQALLRLDPQTGARQSWQARAAWPRGVPKRYGWSIHDMVGDRRTLVVLIHLFAPGSAAPSSSVIESFDVRSGRLLGMAVQRPEGAPVLATALARSGTWLVVGGIANERGRALTRLDPRSLKPRHWPGAPRFAWKGGQPAAIYKIAPLAGRLYLVGDFTAVSGARRTARVAAVSAASGKVLPFNPRLATGSYAEQLVACPGFVAVTGSTTARGNGTDAFDTTVDPLRGRKVAWSHPPLVGRLFAGPAGLLTVTNTTRRSGATLLRGALGTCSTA